MGAVLAIAEMRRGEPREVSYEAIEAARRLAYGTDLEVKVAVIGERSSELAAALTAGSVDEILAIETTCAHFDAHVWSAALVQAVEETSANVVIGAHTVDSMGFLPFAAARYGFGLATNVTQLEWDGDDVVIRRGAYGDKFDFELALPAGSARAIVTVRPGIFRPEPATASVQTRALESDAVARSEHVSYRDAPTGDVDITKADFLLAVGRGIEDETNLAQFEELAERMGATMSVSRPLVDAGWASAVRQVGQSGKTVKPKVYLALGISGAVQHLAGIREAGTVVAVNTDPEAPIFRAADYGVVGDLFEVADALEKSFG